MSILWRIGIASKRGFKHIRLGPHEEILRKMILSKNPGSSDEYGCVMVTLIEEDDGVKGLTITPELLRLSGHRVLRVLINGAVWIFKVSSHSSTFIYKKLFLKENGILTIYSRNANEVKMLKGIAIELGKTGKLDS